MIEKALGYGQWDLVVETDMRYTTDKAHDGEMFAMVVDAVSVRYFPELAREQLEVMQDNFKVCGRRLRIYIWCRPSITWNLARMGCLCGTVKLTINQRHAESLAHGHN